MRIPGTVRVRARWLGGSGHRVAGTARPQWLARSSSSAAIRPRCAIHGRLGIRFANSASTVLATLRVSGVAVQVLPPIPSKQRLRDLYSAPAVVRRQLTFATGTGGTCVAAGLATALSHSWVLHTLTHACVAACSRWFSSAHSILGASQPSCDEDFPSFRSAFPRSRRLRPCTSDDGPVMRDTGPDAGDSKVARALNRLAVDLFIRSAMTSAWSDPV